MIGMCGLGPLGRSRTVTVAGVTYLLRDDFTTPQAAPLTSPRTCEPGPGTLTLVQTLGQMGIPVGKVNFPDPGGAWGGCSMSLQSGLSRVCGRALLTKVNYSASQYSWHGWNGISTIGSNNAGQHAIFFYRAGPYLNFRIYPEGVTLDDLYQLNTEYELLVVLRSTGAFHFIRGGIYSNWTLLWVSNLLNTATMYPAVSNSSAIFALDYFRVVDLASLDYRFATDFGLATSRIAGSVVAGQTVTHEANCLLDFVITTRPTSGNVDVIFRRMDASNYWICRISSSGDLSLQEVIAGATTQRANAAGIVSSGHRVVLTAEGTTIRAYSNNVLRWTYTSANNFQSATAGMLNSLGTGGVVSDLVAWPRTVTLPEV